MSYIMQVMCCDRSCDVSCDGSRGVSCDGSHDVSCDGDRSCDVSCDSPSCSSQFQSTPLTTLAPEKAPRAVSFLLLLLHSTEILREGGRGGEGGREGREGGRGERGSEGGGRERGRGRRGERGRGGEGERGRERDNRALTCSTCIYMYMYMQIIYTCNYRGEEGVAMRKKACRGLCLSPW